MTSALRWLLAMAPMAAACVRGPAPVAPRSEAEACLLSRSAPGAPDTLTVALSGPHLPSPAAPPETLDRSVAGAAYGTLITLNCRDHRQPSLAVAWVGSPDRRRWTVTLAADVRLADGTLLSAQRVIETWRRYASGRMLVPWAGLERADLVDDHHLTLMFAQPDDSLPRVLAHPGLAIARARLDSASDELTVTRGDRILRFVARPPDVRDLLDRGVDLMLTSEPSILAYARAHPEYLVRPLAARIVYPLVVPSAMSVDTTRLDLLRHDLVRDLLLGQGDTATALSWWSSPLNRCPPAFAVSPSRPLGHPPVPTLLYPAGDATARSLAERLAALASSGELSGLDTTSRIYAQGLAGGAFDSALAGGRAVGYLVPLPEWTEAPCLARRQLITRAPWLGPNDSGVVIPLVRRPLNAIIRRGSATWVAGAGGAIYLAGRP